MFHRLPMNSPDLTMFLFSDASAIFSARSRSLYGLDGAATAALLALDAGEEGCGASHEMEWLLSESVATDEHYAVERERLPVATVNHLNEGWVCRLLNTRFLLRAAGSVASPFLPLLEHLADPHPGPVDIVVDIEPRNGMWQVLFNGVALDAPVSRAQLFPFLQGRLRVLAYQGIDFLLAIHGAVLEREGRGLLLPGHSGAGKSTLSMALLGQGYHLLSDEVAVIDAVGRRAHPIPMAAPVKSGSWPVLAPLHPELESAPEHTRWDGQRVRYIAATPERFAAGPCPIDAIIFPRYEGGASLERRRLDELETLREITAAGYQLKGGLDEEKAEALLDWLLDIPAFALRYGTTEQALQGVASCVSQ